MDIKNISKIALIVSAIFLPFWVTFSIFIFSVFYFENFYFGLFVMLLVDLLYGFETIFLWNMPGVLFFSSVVFFLISMIIKKIVNIEK
jgi:hypothetical protein